MYGDSDLDNVPFADSIYNRGVSLNKPLVVIEPSYKINGKDATKDRSSHQAGEQGGKTTVRPAADKAGATLKPDSKSEGAPSTEPKADPRAVESPKSETKDSNASLESTSHPKTDDKVEPPPKSTQKLSSNAAETSSPDEKVQDPIPNNPPQNKRVTDKQQKIARQGSKLDNPVVSSTESGIDKADGVEKLPVSQPPKVIPSLEDNIVLGVALEGSKRTLPIEEEMPPLAADAKELASASRNGNGSTADVKKDGLARPASSNPYDQ